MRSHTSIRLAFVMLGLLALPAAVNAAKPTEQHPMAAKLQAMVRQLSSERDTLKAENTKLAAENGQLQSQLATVKQSAEASAAAEMKLQADLAAAQTNATRLQGQVGAGQAKLYELTALGKKLNQSKSQLTGQLAQLQQLQTVIASELEVCGNKNMALLKSTKEMVGNFNSRDFFSALLGKESVVGFKGVEIENQIQAYQDKLMALRYLKKADTEAIPENSESPLEASNPPETSNGENGQ